MGAGLHRTAIVRVLRLQGGQVGLMLCKCKVTGVGKSDFYYECIKIIGGVSRTYIMSVSRLQGEQVGLILL